MEEMSNDDRQLMLSAIAQLEKAYAPYSQFHVGAAARLLNGEIFVGSNQEQQEFWENFFSRIVVLPFDSASSQMAVQIFKDLKAKNKLIEIPDIFIAATAIQNNLPLATTNLKHFDRIEGLELVSM